MLPFLLLPENVSCADDIEQVPPATSEPTAAAAPLAQPGQRSMLSRLSTGATVSATDELQPSSPLVERKSSSAPVTPMARIPGAPADFAADDARLEGVSEEAETKSPADGDFMIVQRNSPPTQQQTSVETAAVVEAESSAGE